MIRLGIWPFNAQAIPESKLAISEASSTTVSPIPVAVLLPSTLDATEDIFKNKKPLHRQSLLARVDALESIVQGLKTEVVEQRAAISSMELDQIRMQKELVRKEKKKHATVHQLEGDFYYGKTLREITIQRQVERQQHEEAKKECTMARLEAKQKKAEAVAQRKEERRKAQEAKAQQQEFEVEQKRIEKQKVQEEKERELEEKICQKVNKEKEKEKRHQGMQPKTIVEKNADEEQAANEEMARKVADVDQGLRRSMRMSKKKIYFEE